MFEHIDLERPRYQIGHAMKTNRMGCRSRFEVPSMNDRELFDKGGEPREDEAPLWGDLKDERLSSYGVEMQGLSQHSTLNSALPPYQVPIQPLFLVAFSGHQRAPKAFSRVRRKNRK
jgi:hypothetical protein